MGVGLTAGLTNTETTIAAGRDARFSSGQDLILDGAQASRRSVTADVGRNLWISSRQDSDRYDMKQTGSSAGVSGTWGAGAGVSGSVSASRDRMNSNFDSVKEQSGIFAGSGGFDIKVGNHTQLDGGVLASTALAANDQIRIIDSLKNWGFSLCYLYLRNVKGFRFNHKCVYRINCELSLNMRIKPKKPLKRDKPKFLAVPESCNECGSMDFMHYQSSDSRSARLLNVINDFHRETLAI